MARVDELLNCCSVASVATARLTGSPGATQGEGQWEGAIPPNIPYQISSRTFLIFFPGGILVLPFGPPSSPG